ncbi:MAG: glycosyltransferase [Prevotella sp.]|jgi:glycosyltransferase involved in cell wall biosynthesis|nr:glycosyltransferase [Prevotella sp.]
MKSPLVSIIIPLYNKEKSIKTTIESALHQSYSNIEIVVIDDGSTDNSADIAKNLAKQDNRIHFVHQENSGASSARNRGVRESSGDWIMYFDADDLLYDYCVESLVKMYQEHPGADIYAGNCNLHYPDKTIINMKHQINGLVKNNLRSFYFWHTNTGVGCSMRTRKAALQIPYPEEYDRFEDLKLILEVFNTFNIYSFDKPLCCVRLEYSSLSHPAKNVDKDYLFNMEFSKYPFWGKMIMGKMLYWAYVTYPQYKSRLFHKYGWYNLYMLPKVPRLIGHITKILIKKII